MSSNIAKSLLTLVLVAAFGFLNAQNFNDTVQFRFSDPVYTCSNDSFCVNLMIRNISDDDVSLGGVSGRFQYDTSIVTFPPEIKFGIPAGNHAIGSTVTLDSQIVWTYTFFTLGYGALIPADNQWYSVAALGFQVKQPDSCITLDWRLLNEDPAPITTANENENGGGPLPNSYDLWIDDLIDLTVCFDTSCNFPPDIRDPFDPLNLSDTIIFSINTGDDTVLCLPVFDVPEDNFVHDTLVQVPIVEPDYSISAIGFSNDTCLLYTALPGSGGVDTFSYAVCDQQGLCDTVTIIVNIIEVNVPPNILDSNQLDAGSSINVSLTECDIEEWCFILNDPNGDSVSHTVNAVNGTVIGVQSNDTLCLTYTAPADDFITDQIEIIACDSAMLCDTLHINVTLSGPAERDTVNTSVCAGTSFSGVTVTADTSFTLALTTFDGCDSIVVFNITALPIHQIAQTITVCPGVSVPVGSNNYTVPAVYFDTLNNQFGCDSIIQTTLQNHPTYLDTVPVSICAGDSYFAQGANQTTAGIYYDTLNTINNCDSVIATDLSLITPVTTTVDTFICDGQSYFAQGANQTTTGSYFDTLVAASSCDSILRTNLTVHPNTSDTINQDICQGDSVFLAGQWQNSTGTYVDSFMSIYGCDSIRTTNLTVLAILQTTVAVSICEGESYLAGGALQTMTGNYYDTLSASIGCDSIHETQLTVHPVFLDTVLASICQGETYQAGGAAQTMTGVYFDTLTSVNMCDSVIRTELTVLPNVVTSLDTTICGNQSILAGGAMQNTTGFYFDTLMAANGCDSVFVTDLTVLPVHYDTVSVIICIGDSFNVGGTFYDTNGVYTDFNMTINGCDSFHTVLLTASDPIIINLSPSICEGDSFRIANGFVDTTGVYVDSLIAQGGCDSVVITTLTVRPHYLDTITPSICQGDSFQLSNGWVSMTGTYFDSLQTQFGCDSLVRVELSVLNNVTTNINTAICQGDSILIGSTWVSTAGMHYDSLTSGIGCDSVVAYNVTVNPVFDDTVNLRICAGDSVFASGSWQFSSGTYLDTFMTAANCDSTVTTILVVDTIAITNLASNICVGDSQLINGSWETTTGIYHDTLLSINGCDSILEINLTVFPTYIDTVIRNICQGDSLFVGGSNQGTSGTYFDTLQSVNNCDSLIRTELTVHPTYSTTNDTAICAGDSVFVGGAWQNSNGTYYDSLNSVNGCDSVLATNLVVHPNYMDTIRPSICVGDSFFAGGTWQFASGTFTDNLNSINGCDSTVTTILQVDSILIDSFVTNLCPGDSVFAGGAWQQTAGTYIDTATSQSGCDSLAIWQVFTQPAFSDSVQTTICQGDSLFLDGAWQTTNGTYVDTFNTPSGCDSIVTTTLTVLDLSSTLDTSICMGSGVFAGGALQTSTGTYYDTLMGSNGCDSLLITNLTVNPVYNDSVNSAICAGDSAFVGNAWQTNAGTYIDTINSTFGCDSIVTTILRVDSSTTNTIDSTICQGDSVLFGGSWLNADGTYGDTINNIGGCDSVITVLNLTVVPIQGSNVNRSICQGDSIQVNGVWVNTPGVYFDSLSNQMGCDSVVTINLSIIVPAPVNLNIAICQGDSLFLGGAWQTTTGTYQDTLLAQGGCDSLYVTTNLTVNPTYQVNQNSSICIGDSAFLGGSWQTTAGTYYDTLNTQGNCDSLIITQLSIVSADTTTVMAAICEGQSYFAGGALQTQSGTYLDQFTGQGGCDSLHITQLTVHPNTSATIPVSMCVGDSIFLNNSWVSSAGNYPDTLVNGNGCDSFVTYAVTTSPRVMINPDTTQVIALGQSIILSTNISDPVWTPSDGLVCPTCPETFATPTQTTTYTVINPDSGGCAGNASVTIIVQEPSEVYIPNVFTPNGDMVNDYWYIQAEGVVAAEIHVFDRWGNMVFEAFDLDKRWDGTFKGKPKDADVYAYTITLTYFDGPKVIYGNVTLVR